MAERWRGSLIQIRGDWEFLCSVFRFPCCNAAGNMCWMCSAANTGRLFWTAVGDSAGLRATRRTHAPYVAELLAQRRPVPPLFSVVIGVLLSCVMVDVLHCMDLGDHGARRGKCLHAMHQETGVGSHNTCGEL